MNNLKNLLLNSKRSKLTRQKIGLELERNRIKKHKMKTTHWSRNSGGESSVGSYARIKSLNCNGQTVAGSV